MTAQTKSRATSGADGDDVSADTATLNAISAAASLSRLSCSSTVATRRGSPSRRPIADAATASGGATTAPRASAAAKATPGNSSQVTQPTTTVVKTTSTTDIARMPNLLCFRSNSDVRAVVAYSSGGSRASSTSSGSSRTSGMPGRKDAAAPTTTSTSGVGQPKRSHRPATTPTVITRATNAAVTPTPASPCPAPEVILSVQVTQPVSRHPAGRSGHRLLGGM